MLKWLFILAATPLLIVLAAFSLLVAYHSAAFFGPEVAIGFSVLIAVYLVIVIVDFVALEGFGVQVAPDWLPVRRADGQSLVSKIIVVALSYAVVLAIACNFLAFRCAVEPKPTGAALADRPIGLLC